MPGNYTPPVFGTPEYTRSMRGRPGPPNWPGQAEGIQARQTLSAIRAQFRSRGGGSDIYPEEDYEAIDELVSALTNLLGQQMEGRAEAHLDPNTGEVIRKGVNQGRVSRIMVDYQKNLARLSPTTRALFLQQLGPVQAGLPDIPLGGTPGTPG